MTMIINKSRAKLVKNDEQEQKTIGAPPAMLYETKGHKTGLCEPVNHLSLVLWRPRRGRILQLVPVTSFGVLRHDILSPLSCNGAQTTYVAGHIFIVGFNSSNIDQQGYKSELSERVVPPATVQCKTNDCNGFKGSMVGDSMVRFCTDPAGSLLRSRGGGRGHPACGI